MSDHIRAKLEALISDSGMFNAGQEEERRRIQRLIAARIKELHAINSLPHVSSVRAELLRIHQALEPC